MFCVLHSDYYSNYVVYDSIDSVRDTWDSLLEQNQHLNSKNLKMLEDSCLENISFKYLLIFDKNKTIIGCAYLQIFNFNAQHFDNSILNNPKLEHIKGYILKQNTNILICGNLFKVDFQGFYFINDNDNKLLLSTLKHFAKKNTFKINFSGVLIKDSLINFDIESLEVNRYKFLKNDTIMKMLVNKAWKSFDDYKQDLSRKYLQRANKIKLTKSLLTTKDLSLDEIEHNSKSIEQLYLNIASKQSIKIGLLTSEYFIQLKKNLSGNFKLIGYYLNEKLVAFSSYIFENESVEIHYIGIDYQYNDSHKLYFNILFDGLEMAIIEQKKYLNLGRTAHEAKSSLGATAINVNNYIWIKLGLPTIVYNYFTKWYNAKESKSKLERYPFKNIPA